MNPLRAVANLQASRIDMGVDYLGAGPILAIGRAKVVLASDKLAGPESCWGKTCVPPPGDMIVYRLLDCPFAGKYVYVVEHITMSNMNAAEVSAMMWSMRCALVRLRIVGQRTQRAVIPSARGGTV